MYEIYINDRPLILCTSAQVEGLLKAGVSELTFEYHGKAKRLLNFIDMMEKSPKFEKVILYDDNLEQLYVDFCSLYKNIDAAGGLVENELGEYLLIYRRGYWDLPKGKKENAEKNAETAVREVMEETGLKSVLIGDYIGSTWHTFFNKKNKRVLKRTFWYAMTTQKQELYPQSEESIEKAEWIKYENIDYQKMKFYPNILSILKSEENK